MIEITFLTNGSKVVSAPENSNLLRVSLREKGGIPFKCGGGLCGTCKCRIERGLESTDAVKPKERRHLTDEQFAQGYRMACQTFVNGDISVSWDPQAGPAKPLSTAVRPSASAQASAPTPGAPSTSGAPAASTTDAE